MSFASEPSAKSLGTLVDWLRTNIHPQVVVSVGIQPSIAAGCIVRTPNRQYDFSLRQSLDMKTEVFTSNLRRGEEAAKEPAAEGAAA
jgi:F0F1-type ATP synthase delta subunit